jgi:hypothetical protein
MNGEKIRWYIFWIGIVLAVIGSVASVFAWRGIQRDLRSSEETLMREQKRAKVTQSYIAAKKEIERERQAELSKLAQQEKSPLFVAPPTPDMEKMKHLGCVVDGFLSDYGGESNAMAKYIDGSKCYYLHRSLETWLAPPDFEKAVEIKNKVKRTDIVYGMFLAEAINKNEKYFYPEENRYFRFGDMCRSGTDNDWGEHTCKPSFGSEEYRKYLREITRRAMDMGIQSFLFGQIFYQESKDLDPAWARVITTDMRAYAEWLGMDIVIGAQTNTIDDPSYLGLFDFIDGGVGIDAQGNFPEHSACHPRWWQKQGDWCWALLWNDRFAKNARNVFIHLDWSGKVGDDMSHFTRMDEGKRASTLRRLYDFFTGRGDGFLMPVLAQLAFDNNGCTGISRHFYSPQKQFGCNDERAIDNVFLSWLKK